VTVIGDNLSPKAHSRLHGGRLSPTAKIQIGMLTYDAFVNILISPELEVDSSVVHLVGYKAKVRDTSNKLK
jgi:hypothetical protein